MIKKHNETAHYALDPNQLYIFNGIMQALELMEERFDLDFDELLKKRKRNKQ
ncbi:hypothetical protein [Candidatus Venteria ishoeyi]|uniref:hypothetical protein n=1 Tax=Candidatus Venteria ishoeyi TaxID=1899563 RepID=UPI0015ADAD41|nr:hypothetical protein [Candidatus Venteria ishoeyi]